MWTDDKLAIAKAFIAFIIGIIALIGGIAYLGYHFDKKTCYTKYAQFQPEYVGWATGCMITVDEERVPASSLRMTI